MSSTRDVAYSVGPGVVLMIFSTLVLPPLSWGGMNTRGSCYPWTGMSPQVCRPLVPLPQVPLPRHLLTVRSHDGLEQNQDRCLLFLRHPPLFLVKLQSPLRQFSGQEPQIV